MTNIVEQRMRELALSVAQVTNRLHAMINGSRPGIGMLETEAKTDLVSAINEIHDRVDSVDLDTPRVHVHQQAMPVAVWVINHALGRIPVTVTVVDHSGETCIGDVLHITGATTEITFAYAISGTARLIG